MSDATSGTRVEHDVLSLVRSTATALQGTEHATAVAAIEARLTGPLRIAIAGRIKAGKSTLLNALVGAKVAPTDAGECTKVVSWYRNGQLYQVDAQLHNGERRSLQFTRHEGSLDVKLGGLSPADVDHLDIQWPTSKLQKMTLIDTPGLESLNDENSRRTRDFLEVDSEGASDVDAVIYLMRHLHTTDVAFLDAYMDRSIPESSPVNAVAVLSRADEIGAGRLDSMASAARIAARYRSNGQVRSLAATVVPVAGLLAETGLTLREEEARALRTISELPDAELDTMLLSAGHFLDVEASDLTVETRRELLARLGLYGVRLSMQEMRAGNTTATALAPKLIAASGLGELNTIIDQHFLPRARILQSRTALSALRSLSRRLSTSHPGLADSLDRDTERIEATAVEFAQMRAAHLVASGTIKLTADDAGALERLLLGTTPAASLGLAPHASRAEIEAAAGLAMSQWRSKANDPLAGPARFEIFQAAARTAEHLYASATSADGPTTGN